MPLSYLAESLIGSEIVRLGNEIKDKIRAGKKIYNFTIGDFDSRFFPIPAALEGYIRDAYREGYTNYPPAEGLLELREAIGQFLHDREGLDYGPTEILVAAGGRPLIYSLYRTLVDSGEKVIYAVPSWNNNHYVHFIGAQHVVVETTPEARFMPTAAQIRPLLKGATLLALCSPLNPAGTAFSEQELRGICEGVLEENARRKPDEKKLYVMYDQMYWTLTYGATRHYNPVGLFPEMRKYTVFIDGISKAFAATGLRLGWAMGPADVIARMKAILSHVGAWSPMAEQKATSRYLVETKLVDEHLASFKAALERRLVGIYEGLMELRAEGYRVDAVAPQGAIYLTIQVDLVGKLAPGKTAPMATQEEVTAYLLDAAGLAIVPFNFFGARNSSWYRLSVGTCSLEDIPAMLQRLRKALEALR